MASWVATVTGGRTTALAELLTTETPTFKAVAGEWEQTQADELAQKGAELAQDAPA